MSDKWQSQEYDVADPGKTLKMMKAQGLPDMERRPEEGSADMATQIKEIHEMVTKLTQEDKTEEIIRAVKEAMKEASA